MKTAAFRNTSRRASARICGIAFAGICLVHLSLAAQEPVNTAVAPRLIEVIADHHSRFSVPGQKEPSITVKPGEEVRLRITAIKAANRNRDGAVHGFTLLNAKDHKPVPGWDFLLQPGTQEFTVIAPLEPGNYEVVCTVICSDNHEQMNMKFTVLPNEK